MATDDKQPAKKHGCVARFLRVCGWTLLAVLTLLLSCYFVEVYRCSRFTPTGDALFDKYARAVIKRQAWRLFMSNWDSVLTTVDASTLREWENEFGDDPRYWLLCYSCATDCDPAQGVEYVDQGLSEKYYYLDQAIQRGCADVNVLYFAFSEHSDLWWSLIWEDYSSSEHPVAWKDLTPLQRDARFNSLCGDEIASWLERMIEAAPDESYPYYMRARYHFVKDDFEQALRDFEAGNTAAINRIPSSFPASLIRENTDAEERMGSSYAYSTIAYFHQFGPLPNFSTYKDIVKESVENENLADDPRWRSTIRDFALRFTQLRRDEELFPMVSSVMLLIQAKYFIVEQGDKLSVDQRDDIFQLIGRVGANVRNLTEHRQRMYCHEEHYQAHQGFLPGMLAQTMGYKTGEWYRYWYDYMYVEMIEANLEYATLSSGILVFNYETFRWPEPETP